MLRKERETFIGNVKGQVKHVKQLKDDLRLLGEERDKMQKEKDKYVHV